MSETPTSGLAVLVSDLRAIVANSSTFQTLGGFADADEAIENVFLGVVPVQGEGDLPRPHAVVFLGEGASSMSLGTGAQLPTFASKQTAYIGFECEVPSDPATLDYRDSPEDAYVHFLNQVGGLINDIATCPQTVHTQIIRSVSMHGEVYKNDSNEALWHGVRLKVETGIGR